MVCDEKKRKKFNPRPKIVYPPVPTKKWIPPDFRHKRVMPPPQLRYRKPPGMDQRVKPSALWKIWRRFFFFDDTAILTGTFSQTHKRFTFKSNGLQSSCNCAIACIFAHILPMELWDKYLLDTILILGDQLFRKSLEQDPDRCWTEIDTERVYTSLFIGRKKVSFEIDKKNRVDEILSAVNEDKIKKRFQEVIEGVLKIYFCGIFTMHGCKKVLAFWFKEGRYYLFDPTAHTSCGVTWANWPGGGLSIVYRCKTMECFIDRLYENITCYGSIILESLAHCHCWGALDSKFTSKICKGRFWVEPCMVLRVTDIDTTPPETYEDVRPIMPPHDWCFRVCPCPGIKGLKSHYMDQTVPTESQLALLMEVPVDIWDRRLKKFLEDEEQDNDPKKLAIEELSPEVDNKFSMTKRPSWLQEEFDKSDHCKFEIPYDKRPDAMSFFVDIEPGRIAIMRAGTHIKDPNFTKYMGRQVMGDAISALIMLKFWKSKHWVPVLLNKILKFGDLLYRDAMISIPRTQSLKLSNFQKKSEYMGKYFLPIVEDYVVVGRLSSKEFEVLDLFGALESFLIENQCCVIIGPIVLAVWVEDGYIYMFDPNQRDSRGNAEGNFEDPPGKLDCVCPNGKACLLRFTNVEDLVDLYMRNVEKPYKSNPFYLSRVQVHDWVDIPEAWANFKGFAPGKWILRATINQNDRKYDIVSKNFQSPATSMILMAMKQIKPLKEWADTDVNELLDYGDRFYRETIDTLREKNSYNNKMLLLSDLNKEFKFFGKLVEFTLEECVQNGIFTAKCDTGVMNLYKAMAYYYLSHDDGIITCRNMSVGVWKFEDMFFYSDSHSRDDKGLTTPFGTACIVRCCSLEDIVDMILCNFAPNPEDYFNITNVKMRIYELDFEGIIKPVLMHYRRVHKKKYIVRSLYQDGSSRYELNAGKQQIPMLIMSICYNKLKPSEEWNQADVDEIMNKGDNLYTASMLDILTKEENKFIGDTMDHVVYPGGKKRGSSRGGSDGGSMGSAKPSETTGSSEGDGDSRAEVTFAPNEEIEINLQTMRKVFNIGLNKFTVLHEDVGTGIIEPDLRVAVRDYYESLEALESGDQGDRSETGSSAKDPSSEGDESSGKKAGQSAAADDTNRELLILIKTFTVIIWRDSKLFYLFDCKSRDIDGNVIGASNWSDVCLTPAQRKLLLATRRPAPKKSLAAGTTVEETKSSKSIASAKSAGDRQKSIASQGGDRPKSIAGGGDDGEGDADKKEPSAVVAVDNFEEGEEMGEDYGQEGEEQPISYGEYEAIVEGILFPPPIERSASYWDLLAKSGRGCALAFTTIDALIDHIIKNIRPKLRWSDSYELKTIRVINSPEKKDIMRPQDIRNTVYEGQWYDFDEIERGVWILRGSLSLIHETFPSFNRGRQCFMMAVCALGIVYTFGVICFNKFTVDTILKYGDRLLTWCKKIRKQQMQEYDPNKLCDEEIDWILQHEEFGVDDVPKRICIWKFMIHVECKAEVVTGDIRAEPFLRLIDVQRGVDKFFEENRFGILQCKELAVAIWRGGKLYYMCDGMNRGPNGITDACGTGCVTRYIKTEHLVKTFVANLTRLGKNNFYIHAVTFGRDICPRVRTPITYIPPKIDCIANVCREIVPGKTIVRGSINQDDPKFGKLPGALSLPIAFIALTMTLIHKTQIWSKPIVDEVIEIGNELYDITVDSLGYSYNPWEDNLNVCQVKHDFYVGVLRANLEVRNMEQKGIIEPTDPCIWNLRMAIDRFFDENTHGIVVTEYMILAIWEEEIENSDPLIYIYDPNSRGPTGLPTYNGVACLISCLNPRMAAKHICSCILEPEHKLGPFKILPVEIVVGTKRTPKKLRKVDSVSTMVLPRCREGEINKKKRLMRKLAEYERRRKEYRRRQLIGRRAYYLLNNGDSIIRGYRSTNSECYPDSARNNQDLPMSIIALVMHVLFSIENWTYKNVDLVLDTGNQLYLDSYIAYGPKDPKLGPENIIRKFFLKHLTIKVTIYKPIVTDEFVCTSLLRVLGIFFSQEPFCLFYHKNQWVALIAKAGYFYLFDPHPRDLEGCAIEKIDKCEPGTAVVVKCDSVERLVCRLLENLTLPPQENGTDSMEQNAEENSFTLWLISVAIR
ncbi:unnamed protein product [Phyllotreta striolata]|uniref:Uncharacterized protein n=1 Tax=Phyllotreta striolata TaxID=444603 RepID=A0A9N9TEB7_PHYSR|nr:unnamed protein product [Phyllotreta striolata]